MKMILTIYIIMTVTTTAVLANHVIDESESPQFLLVISAASGSYNGETLTLTGIPAVVYFSDRPFRVAGHMSLNEFVELWGEGGDDFAIDPPNATLSIFDDNGIENIVVELSDLQRENDTLSFKVRLLTGEVPASFGAASVFVDQEAPAMAMGSLYQTMSHSTGLM